MVKTIPWSNLDKIWFISYLDAVVSFKEYLWDKIKSVLFIWHQTLFLDTFHTAQVWTHYSIYRELSNYLSSSAQIHTQTWLLHYLHGLSPEQSTAVKAWRPSALWDTELWLYGQPKQDSQQKVAASSPERWQRGWDKQWQRAHTAQPLHPSHSRAVSPCII